MRVELTDREAIGRLNAMLAEISEEQRGREPLLSELKTTPPAHNAARPRTNIGMTPPRPRPTQDAAGLTAD